MTRSTAINPIIADLNKLLANLIDFYFTYKHFHWHITGQDFYPYHLEFDKNASIIYANWDLIAERIRQLGGEAQASGGQVINNSNLPQYASLDLTKQLNLQDYVLIHLEACHEQTIITLNSIIEQAGAASDFSTADILTTILEEQQQMHWFISSSIDNLEE